jgi:hypothetical protein
VTEVIVEEAQGDALQPLRGRRNLREDIDAVPVLLDHLGDPPHLTFDPPQAGQEVILAHVVSSHGATIPL